MRWHTKPIMQLVVMLVVMSVVIGAQSTASALLASSTKNIPVAQSQNAELRRVAAEMADPTCPNTDPVQYALTENNVAIAPPKRMRYVDAPWEYDTLNTNYFSRTDSESEFAAAGNLGTKAENLTFMADGQGYDSRIASIMSSIFRYTPTAFRNAYVLKYSGAPRGNDTPHKGDAPAIEVPSKAGWPVCVPTTGYDIGGGYEAMVVAAESNRITLHIGIHEYMVGQDPVLGGCPAGQQCKGGYWLYISGIAVDSDILSAYNGKKGIQQGAGLSQNITDRIQLPVVKPGRRLGTSQGDGVTVLLRDSGPVIYANKNFMWGGGFPEYDPGTTPTATPPAGATNTPPPGAPTATPTAVPTVVPPAAGKGNLLVTVANNIYDLSCSANLVTFWDSDNIHGFDINQYSGFMKDQQVVVIAQNLEPGTYTIDSTYGVYQSGSFSKTYVSTPVEQNVIIRPGQTTETILSLTNAGTNYEECIAVPTPTTPPNATPTPSGIGVTPITTGPNETTFKILVSDSCDTSFCNSLRFLISDISAGDYEGSDGSLLYWVGSNGNEYSTGLGSLTELLFAQNQGVKGFSFLIHDPRMPAAYSSAQSVHVHIQNESGGLVDFPLK